MHCRLADRGAPQLGGKKHDEWQTRYFTIEDEALQWSQRKVDAVHVQRLYWQQVEKVVAATGSESFPEYPNG